MQCSKETLVRLFYNVSSSFLLLFIFFYYTSIVLAKVFHFLGGNPFLQRNQDEYEYGVFSEEEEEEENDGYFHVDPMERDHHLVADIVHGGEALSFLSTPISPLIRDSFFVDHHDVIKNPNHDEQTDQDSSTTTTTTTTTNYSTPASESENYEEEEEVIVEDIQDGDSDFDHYSPHHRDGCGTPSPITLDLTTNNVGMRFDSEIHHEIYDDPKVESQKADTNFTKDDKFVIFASPKLESKKMETQGKDISEEIYEETCTVGSTSKSSSEWRSSINCRDSGTEDPFSSSSRRSCPKWESYTVFQKYDEEMLFLDRISAQKLHETESLKTIQACPRSISERVVQKMTRKNNRAEFGQNPYHELEAAYVAQICLTWEALNWNYNYFQRLRAARRESDPGCPAHVAQQFQQFQVLLQRYVENEPYEHGRRPEIYARMRSLAPKLLQVPEYRDSDDEQHKEESFRTRIPSASFLMIMEESIRTFMNFLKADKETHCQILAAFFRPNRRANSVDPTILLLLKKVNNKKKMKLKDLRRARKCLMKRKLREDVEMGILMGLIDLKVVSRVLRMRELSEEQLHWCEDKMGKVKIRDGKLQRDSSPLFFPAH